MPTIDRTTYAALRRSQPLSPAYSIVSQLRRLDGPVLDFDWSHGEPSVTFERDGFEIVVTFELESTAPIDGDFGHYVDDSQNDPNGEGTPTEPTPLGLPARHFRYAQGSRDCYAYFYPDNVVDYFEHARASGCSKSVARDLTASMVTETVERISEIGYYVVVVTAARAGVVLGRAVLGTTDFDDEIERHVSELVDETDLVDEALDEARAKLAELVG